MKTFMVTFMVERNSRNLCRWTNHQVTASENLGTDKAPAQRVHGCNHEGFMVRLVQFRVGKSPSVALDNENTITPAQRVHGCNHEGFMVASELIRVGASGGTRPKCRLPQATPTPCGARRDELVRGHGWWTPFDPFPVRCHTVASRQRSLRNTARPRRSPARRRRGRPLCPRSASGRPFDRWPRCGQCASSD